MLLVDKDTKDIQVTVVKKELKKVMLLTGNQETPKTMVNARGTAHNNLGALHLSSTMKTRSVISTPKMQVEQLVILQTLVIA
jgi:hypothetical protein